MAVQLGISILHHRSPPDPRGQKLPPNKLSFLSTRLQPGLIRGRVPGALNF